MQPGQQSLLPKAPRKIPVVPQARGYRACAPNTILSSTPRPRIVTA